MTDARGIGLNPPVRESGKLADSPGCKLTGPAGSIEIDHGVIIARRHVHLSPSEALEAGLKDKDVIRVRLGGERGIVFEEVLVRAGETHLSEFHIDTDEGNAAGAASGQEAELLSQCLKI
jgi:putative phosphotransacetylase